MNQTHHLNRPLTSYFPQDFMPERHLLGELLRFAAGGGTGDKEAISTQTGIPTGKSTGKVEPMIRYAWAMGLIDAAKDQGEWELSLTPLGRTVHHEDLFMNEPLTLWLLHLMISRRFRAEHPATGIADAWYTLFAEGATLLGRQFHEQDLHRVLVQRYGEKDYLKRLSTLIPRMYIESGSFGEARILTRDDQAADGSSDSSPRLVRQPAPTDSAFYPAYAVYLYILWDELFGPDYSQLDFSELAQISKLRSLLWWEETQVNDWLEWIANRGWIQIDRYTGSAMLLRLSSTEHLLDELYGELV